MESPHDCPNAKTYRCVHIYKIHAEKVGKLVLLLRRVRYGNAVHTAVSGGGCGCGGVGGVVGVGGAGGGRVMPSALNKVRAAEAAVTAWAHAQICSWHCTCRNLCSKNRSILFVLQHVLVFGRKG